MKFDTRTMEEVVPADISEGDYIITHTTVGSHIEMAEGRVDTIYEFNGFKEFQDEEGYPIWDWEVADATDTIIFRISAFEAKFTQLDTTKLYIGPSNQDNASVVFWYDELAGGWSGADLENEDLGVETDVLISLVAQEYGYDGAEDVIWRSLANSDLNQIKEYTPEDFRQDEKALKEGKIFVSADGKNLYTFEDGSFYTYVRHNYFGLKSEYKRTMHTLDLPKGLVEHKVEFKDIFERDSEVDQLLYHVKTKAVYKIRKNVSNHYMVVDGSKVVYSYDLNALMRLHLNNDLVQL